MSKKIKVVYRKLGREQADGQTYCNGVVEIDERLKGRRAFLALFHELFHHANPNTAEEEVLRQEKEIAPILWREMQKHPEKYK